MILVAIFAILAKMAASMNMEVHEKFLTMDSKEFTEYFNSQNFSWKITDYNQTFYIGSLQSPINDEGIQRECNGLHYLPQNFDARKMWPHCETIRQIYNQGTCGSCWAFGVANTASDRTCIHKNVHVHLAEQDYECLKSNVCSGGFTEDAFSFWYNSGLVTNKCKPYDIQKLKTNTCQKTCVNQYMSYSGDKHYAKKIYRIHNNINCIKSELVQNGPVEATFTVYKDFFKYGGGIYKHTFGEQVGIHSVRVIGYGVEYGLNYWLVANSWSEVFGERGYFKIQMQQSDIGFEKNVITGLPYN